MFRRLFRWLFRLLILAVVLAVAAVLLKDTMAKAWVEWQVRRQTGLSVVIRKLEVALTAPVLTMEGFRLFNPPEYGGSLLCDVAEAQLEYEPRSLRDPRIHLRVLRLNLSELNVVRNKAGQTNLFLLLGTTPGAAMGRQPSGTSGLVFDDIERLYLTVGAVRFVDLLQPQKNWQTDLKGKNYEMDHVRSWADIQSMILRLALEGRMAMYEESTRAQGSSKANAASARHAPSGAGQ